MIVGVDAGLTTAIAFVSLDGKPVSAKSGKHWGFEEAMLAVAQGAPSVEIVACDTNPSSHFAKQLASAFGARAYVPRHSLPVIDKERIAQKSGLKLKNKHERDALAAAVCAWRHYQNKLRQAGTKAVKAGKAAGEVQKRVLAGEKMAYLVRK
jgi:predicted RNase H-like nuclease (RuvC/YqgF family)